MDNVYWTSSLNVIYIAGAVDCQIAGASPGGLGSILSQNAWLGADFRSGGRRLPISRAGVRFVDARRSGIVS
jgi:hypothetical protein